MVGKRLPKQVCTMGSRQRSRHRKWWVIYRQGVRCCSGIAFLFGVHADHCGYRGDRGAGAM